MFLWYYYFHLAKVNLDQISKNAHKIIDPTQEMPKKKFNVFFLSTSLLKVVEIGSLELKET